MSFTRIVVMTFKEGEGSRFRGLFDGWKTHIAGFDGCIELNLVQDMNDSDTFMTISKWESLEALENYRKSELFGSVWPVVKPMFREKARAWSVNLDWSNKDDSERSL